MGVLVYWVCMWLKSKLMSGQVAPLCIYLLEVKCTANAVTGIVTEMFSTKQHWSLPQKLFFANVDGGAGHLLVHDVVCDQFIGPIPWGHSGPLSRVFVVVVVVVDIDAQAARDSTASDTWWMGVRRLAVANGPNIFQMLLVSEVDYWGKTHMKCDCYSGFSSCDFRGDKIVF